MTCRTGVKDQRWYISTSFNDTSLQSTMSNAWDVARDIVEPYLVSIGAYSVKDPSELLDTSRNSCIAYGRYTLPPHPPHLQLINHPKVRHRYRRIFLRPISEFSHLQDAYETTDIIYAEDVKLTPEEIQSGVAKGGRWICYSIWEMAESSGRGTGCDLVLAHGKV